MQNCGVRRNAAIKKGVKADDQGCINIPCSYDVGWQKQGNALSVRTVRVVRTLFKDNQPIKTVSLGKSLENFLTYLEKTVKRVRSDNIYTVLIRHNSRVFDTPTLLLQGGHQLCEKLYFLTLFLWWRTWSNVNIPLWSYQMVPQLN